MSDIQWKKVTEEEFGSFIKNYGKSLEGQLFAMMGTYHYHDYSDGKKHPESEVAYFSPNATDNYNIREDFVIQGETQ